MANETIGLGANLSMNAKPFLDQQGKARDEFGRFVRGAKTGSVSVVNSFTSMAGAAKRTTDSFKKMGAGITALGGAARSAALAMAPFTAAFGLGAKKAVDFQQGMQNVRAIMNPTEKDFIRLELAAKRMGATTKFSATEATGGLELLGRAGFDTNEAISALPGLASLAAADNLDLATAADVAANTIRGMGLEANQLGQVADVLATVSAKTNTNVQALGEGMKFLAPVSKTLGINMKETSLALGLVANAGLKGTSGGTALKNMFLKLTNPSKKTIDNFSRLGVKVQDAAGNMLPMTTLIKNIGAGMAKAGGNMKKAGILAEAFGLRGIGATTALAGQMKKMGETMVPVLDAMGKPTDKMQTKFQELVSAIDNSAGAAKRMADVRMQSITGQVTLIGSALEGLAIEGFQPFMRLATTGFKAVADVIQGVVATIQQIKNPTAEGTQALSKVSSTVQLIGIGVLNAVDKIQGGISFLINKFREAKSSVLGALGPDTISKAAEFAVMLGTLAAVMAPVLAGVGGFAFIMTSVIIPAVTGLFAVVSGLVGLLIGPFGLALAAVAGIFLLLRRNGESFGDTMLRIWGTVRDGAVNLWQNGILPFLVGFQEMWRAMSGDIIAVWSQMKVELTDAWDEVMTLFSDGTGGMQVDWLAVGKTVAAVIGTMVKHLAAAVVFIVSRFRAVIDILQTVKDGIQLLAGGNVRGAIKKLGGLWLKFMLEPLRNILLATIQLADTIGASDFVPKGLREFAESGLLAPITSEAGGDGGAPPPATVAANREAERQAAAAAQVPTVNVQPATAAAPNVLNEIRVEIDGDEVGFAVASKQREKAERMGKRATPFNRKRSTMFGS